MIINNNNNNNNNNNIYIYNKWYTMLNQTVKSPEEESQHLEKKVKF
jgi:hypothetical protein